MAGNDDLQFKEDGSRKVVAISTGHEMPPRLEAVQAYINGNKYKRARDWYSYDFSEFEPHVVQHDKHPKFLFCTLTGSVLPKDPSKVRIHVESRRFKETMLAKEWKSAEWGASAEADGYAEAATEANCGVSSGGDWSGSWWSSPAWISEEMSLSRRGKRRPARSLHGLRKKQFEEIQTRSSEEKHKQDSAFEAPVKKPRLS